MVERNKEASVGLWACFAYCSVCLLAMASLALVYRISPQINIGSSNGVRDGAGGVVGRIWIKFVMLQSNPTTSRLRSLTSCQTNKLQI